jgi:hypothetical protein
MTVLIGFFQGYEHSNMTSLSIEITLAFILGFLIYAMEVRDLKPRSLTFIETRT